MRAGAIVGSSALFLGLLIGCNGLDGIAASPTAVGEPGAVSAPAAPGRWYALAQPVPEAARLIGLEPPALRHILGPPDFQRREAQAEFWRYDLEPCTLDLFLHRAADGARYQVAHAQLRPARPGVGDCLTPVLAVEAGAPVEPGLPPVESH